MHAISNYRFLDFFNCLIVGNENCAIRSRRNLKTSSIKFEGLRVEFRFEFISGLLWDRF